MVNNFQLALLITVSMDRLLFLFDYYIQYRTLAPPYCMFPRYAGAIYATLCPSFALLGNMSIFGNYAKFYGGAISLTDPSEIYLIGITFQSNRGTSGGAVYLASDVETTGGFGGCRFVDNNATTNGGALFLSTNATSEPEMARFVEDSVFFNNAAGERWLR